MSHPSEIVMIVPKLPPAIDGIGDYGFHLAKQLYQDFGWKTHFVVGTPERQGEIEGNFFRVTVVPVRSQTALLNVLPTPPATVLLQYAGHGYAKRGCPVWLVNTLEQWCNTGGRLITMFHELYATRPLLSSAILTQHFQKQLVVRLMKFSDRILTNRESYAERILRCSKKEALSIPVFSNVGECLAPNPLNARSRNLVIFGSSTSRQQIYQHSSSYLARICHELNIETIIDIGKKTNTELNQIGAIPIQTLGVQCAEQISQALDRAIAGVVCYPANYLAKSGIFAAYCSHSVLPIVVSKRVQDQDGLLLNQHYVLMQETFPNSLEAIATAAHTWYQTHSLRNQAHSFAQCLQPLT